MNENAPKVPLLGADLVYYALNLVAAAAQVGEMTKKHRYHGHALDAEALVNALDEVSWATATIREMI